VFRGVRNSRTRQGGEDLKYSTFQRRVKGVATQDHLSSEDRRGVSSTRRAASPGEKTEQNDEASAEKMKGLGRERESSHRSDCRWWHPLAENREKGTLRGWKRSLG